MTWPVNITHIPARPGYRPRPWEDYHAAMRRHFSLIARNYPIRISTHCGNFFWFSRRDFTLRHAPTLALAIQESITEAEEMYSGQEG